MIGPELVNALFSGLVLLLGAVATLVTARGRKAGVQRREHRDLQRRLLAALGHIFRLESELAERGVTPPTRPAVLDQDDGEDVAPLPPVARPGNTGGGRHGA